MSKRFLFIAIFIMAGFSGAYAQSTTGLIAHWPFNGNANDVSAKGHNGTAQNIIYTVGKAGKPNTAAQFNGISSIINVPFSPDMDVTSFSICAVVRVDDFYKKRCQASVILQRAAEESKGSYALYVSDNPYNGDCDIADADKNVFFTHFGTISGAAPHTKSYYTPNIVLKDWYCVVSTFNGDSAKVFVDGVLKASYKAFEGGLGSSKDGLAIGASAHGNYILHPYWFNGIIDDIKLYSRALANTEIVEYCNRVMLDDSPSLVTNAAIENLSLSPNPNSGDFILKGTVNSNQTITAEVLNSIGQVVYKDIMTPVGNRLNEQVQLSHLTSGVYIITLRDSEGSETTARFSIIN